VDFKRLPAGLGTRLATAPPFRSQRNLGSTALDWCWLATGRADLYAHGGQRLWDYAGGALVFAEAGGTPCLLDRWDGECREDLTLRKRIAVGAAHPALQASGWRGCGPRLTRRILRVGEGTGRRAGGNRAAFFFVSDQE